MQFDLGIDGSRANEKNLTGTGWYCFNLIQELKKIIPAEVKVALYSREALRNGLEKLPSNWESQVLNWPPKYLWTKLRLSYEMWLRPPKVLFVPAHVLPMKLARANALTLHDVAFATFKDIYSWSEQYYQKLALRFALKKAAQLFTVSEFSKSELISKFGAKADKILVTPLACDYGRFSAASAQDVLRHGAKYNLPKNYFLFVGRIERKKNVARIIEALAQVVATPLGHEAGLVLVGTPGFGYAKEMEKLLGTELRNQVKELGYVPEDDLPALYKGARALVFPSLYEGFGLPILEAMAAGTPVIASNTTAIPEVAGEAALLIDPMDSAAMAAAMLKILTDSDLRQQLIKKGQLQAQKFSWAKTAELTWASLKKLL